MLSTPHLAALGLAESEARWLQGAAGALDAVFAVRPRPARAMAWAKARFNAKPMTIMEKSVSGLDCQWLGYDGRHTGLVVIQRPVDPRPRLLRGFVEGRLDVHDIVWILRRFQRKWADYEGWANRQARLNDGGGFVVHRFGRRVRTQVYLDSQGVMHFSHNRLPVYSDTDLYHVFRWQDDRPVCVSAEEMGRVLEVAGAALDIQHGATVNATDFPSWTMARRRNVELGRDLLRGGAGGPLIVVGPDGARVDFVQRFWFSAGTGDRVRVRYESWPPPTSRGPWASAVTPRRRSAYGG